MKYRKKPVEVEAIKFSADDWSGVKEFTNGNAKDFIANEKATCIISTLEGDMRATEGDYIIKGVKGEFYPCKPDIFELTYDKI